MQEPDQLDIFFNNMSLIRILKKNKQILCNNVKLPDARVEYS